MGQALVDLKPSQNEQPPMTQFSIRRRLNSFVFAFRGARTLLASQHNAWIHAAATLAVVIGGLASRVSAVEWALLVFALGLVWLAEAMNTAIEFLADEVSEEQRDRIGKAKDVAAFGVLASAVASLVIGIIVFLPRCVGPK
jgi:diacylglycerol kinase (ATP)